jgi:alpha-L-rhamnosidase
MEHQIQTQFVLCRGKYLRKLLCIVLFAIGLPTTMANINIKGNTQSLTSSIKKVDYLRCEFLENPLGIDVVNPRLSWLLLTDNPSIHSLSQSNYQILVASSPKLLNNNVGDLWDTRKVKSTQISGIVYRGKRLNSNQTVWWKVRIWDQSGKDTGWSLNNQLTMGILTPADWSEARWVTSPDSITKVDNSTFLLRKEFSVKQGLRRAIVSICGLGQYEMTINGKQITGSLLNPGWTQYDKTCLYDTYDITSLVSEGKNATGVLLSNGMYRVSKKERYAKFQHSFGRLQAIVKIVFEYGNGSISTLITDGTWQAGVSPMTFSSIYGGEDWDARKEEKGWDKPDFDSSKWLPVELTEGPGGDLKGITHAAPPIRTFQVLKPKSSKEIKPNTIIYDLGQEASFICRFDVTGPAGSSIKITPSELLNTDGSLFRNNYNGKSFSVYTLKGEGKESYSSKFFTTGCRYYQVECLPAPEKSEIPQVESIEGIVVHSDIPFGGTFSCSNELFNRTYEMIRWAELSNMKSVISDCPHRERLGWLEQDHLHGPSFRYNYDMSALVGKIIHDMNDTQQVSGLVPCIAPELTVFGPDWREAIEWGSSSILLPWQEYEWTGDIEVLHQNWPMMKHYMQYLTGKSKDGIAAVGKGDWTGRATSPETPKDLVSTAFYYNNAVILAKSARLIGNTEESNIYEKLAEQIRIAFTKKFFNKETKQYGTGSQCANAMALVLGLVDATDHQAVLNNLVKSIEQRQYENTTGEVGFRYLLRALADGNRSDVIFKMNSQSEKPGYGYQLKMGATALPETWDAYKDNSQNQFMLGHIIEWFYHDLAGIQMDPNNPGFKHIIIHPNIVGDLTVVKGSNNSIQGKIISEWKQDNYKLTLHVVIPVNTTASIYVPATNADSITLFGRPVARLMNIKKNNPDDLHAKIDVDSGEYTFEVARKKAN